MVELAKQVLGGASDTGAGGLVLTEQPLRGMITIRADLADSAAANAISKACGVAIPATRRFEEAGSTQLIWMSPDELLLLCDYAGAGETADALTKALGDRHHLVVDVSDARAIFRLEGGAAREVLAKGAPVDLARAAFGVGDVRRTRIGHVAAAFYQIGEGPDVFEIVCFRSYARYLWDWLVASSREGSMPGVLA